MSGLCFVLLQVCLLAGWCWCEDVEFGEKWRAVVLVFVTRETGKDGNVDKSK